MSLVGAIALLGQPSEARAFKMGTHSAAATEVVDQLKVRIDESGGVLAFEINGRQLEVVITEAEAYRAIIDYPDFFRAGVVGPDAFPDPLTGQIMMHGDEALVVKTIMEQMTGSSPPEHESHERFEQRLGPVEYRAIDFVTAMLEFFSTYPAEGSERAQVIAFIIGYVSHGIGDSFAHTWVNELSGGAWALSRGTGLWGIASEEVKHVAVETMVDRLVPSELKELPGDQGGHERIRLRAPTKFLDAFYSAQALRSRVPRFATGNSLEQFLAHYSDLNTYNGGFFYNYLNAQTTVAGTLKSWTRLGSFFDFVEDVNASKFVNFGLDVAQLPEEVSRWLGAAPNPLAWVDDLTNGFVDCHGDAFDEMPMPIGKLREAIEFVGGINARIHVYDEKALIVRRNWMKLAQCTSENLARSGAADFDEERPQYNRDACADIVRAGWEDQGNTNGLYRGSIRPREEVAEVAFVDLNRAERFLLDLKAAFLGDDAVALFSQVDDPIHNHAVWQSGVALERASRRGRTHRSLQANLLRMLDYVADFGFRGDELIETILPDDGGRSQEIYAKLCGAARDPAFERCLDGAFGPIAAVGRGVACAADHRACTQQNVAKCKASACMDHCAAPLSNADCSGLCGTGEVSGCKATCDEWFCLDVCVFNACARICEPLKHTLCNVACNIFNDDDREATCQAAAADEAVCGVEHVVCDAENLASTIANDNYASELLTPLRQACDTVDEALDLFTCLKGDPNLTKDEQRVARRACVIKLCSEQQSGYSAAQCADLYHEITKTYDEAVALKDAVSDLVDAVQKQGPHGVVNLAFLLEDLQRSPEYLEELRRKIDQTRSNWANSPPPPGSSPEDVQAHESRGRAIERLAKLIEDVKELGTSQEPLVDLRAAAGDAAQLFRDLVELDLIPTVVGPTAQDIYREVGPSFRNTFLPFFNTLQGMKLAPLARADIVALFAEQAAPESSARLPYSNAHMSESCRGVGANLYCDVLVSFDDPNCIDPVDCKPVPHPEFEWSTGRSLVAWNEYDPSENAPHVTTAFPLCNSDDSYDNLYTRIFRVPGSGARFAGFDDLAAPWTSSSGQLTINTANRTEGMGSLQIDGCGWSRLTSPSFKTTDWGVVGDELKVDVYVPAPQTNPYWVGDATLFVTVPGAGVYNQPLSSLKLPTTTGTWSSLTWPVPPPIRDALLGDFASAQFNIQLNYSGCGSALLFDNLRFDGELYEREIFHERGSQRFPATTNPLFSFDNPADWRASGLASSDVRVEGAASLAIPSGGYRQVVSRSFSTNELVSVTSNLSLDIYVPKQPSNASWGGTVALSLTCGPYFNAWLGQRELTHPFEGEFNTLAFTLADEYRDLLRGDSGTLSGCQISIILNTSFSGTLLLDNMGFYQ